METSDGRTKFEDFFELQLKLFKVIGFDLMAKKSLSLQERVYSACRRLQFWTCILNVMVFVAAFLVRLVLDIQSIHVVVKILPNVINIPYNFFSKYMLLNTRRHKVLNLLEELRHFYPTTQLNQRKYKMQAQLNHFTNFIKAYSVCYLTLVSSPTIYSAYVLIIHGILAGICCLILIASDATILAIINVLVIEFDMLRRDFKSAIDEGNQRLVRNLIKRHQKLIAIFDEIEEIFSITFLCSFFFGAVSISVCGFQLATSTDLGERGYSIPYTLGSLSQIFMYCYYGQRMTDSSSGISTGLHESNWHMMKDLKFKKMLMMIAQKSQRKNCPVAYGFVELNLETFSKILSSAFSYYTVLKNLYFQ